MDYVARLQQSKEDKSKSLAPQHAKCEAARLGLKIGELQLTQQTFANRLEELKGTHPLNVDAIVDTQNEAALLDRSIAQLQSLASELFPTA